VSADRPLETVLCHCEDRALTFRPVLHHVGIVLHHESDAIDQMSLLGLQEDYRGYVSHWSALCIFTKASSGSQIEFVIPNGGPLSTFSPGLGGLHHIALQVPDLNKVALELQAEGMKLLEPVHVRGAGPFICNFLSPVYTRGLRVEYIQLRAV
jgi:methylmalonyl-CoA/ethylmalonyl-CoA epimerase